MEVSNGARLRNETDVEKCHSGNLKQLIKMLKTVVEKIHKMHDQMGNFSQGDGNFKKESNGNARNKKFNKR